MAFSVKFRIETNTEKPCVAGSIPVRHAVEEHGHKHTAQLRRQIKAMMKPEKNKFLKNYN